MNEQGKEKSYVYRQLGHERVLRVLILKPPASPNADLQGSLIHHRMESEPNYKAVSNTWGVPILSDKLNLDNNILGITANFALALQKFRNLKEEVFLSTDAVCINQLDDCEKGHQVAMMSDIYRQATSVLIWLGEGPGLESISALKFPVEIVANAKKYILDSYNRTDKHLILYGI